jgi:CheY-like chemotaxis protein
MATAQLLIVEDERIVALELRRRLTRLGYAVVGAVASGEDAIAQAQVLRPDLVLMDIGLQGQMTGLEAGAYIRSQLNIPVIYVTAYAPQPAPTEAATTESELYIRKPFEERALRLTIEKALHPPQA